MAEGLKIKLRAYRGGLEVGLLLVLLAVLVWQSFTLYNRLTASPARWAAAMAAGDKAEASDNMPAARDAYARAVAEARKFGPRDARLALALDGHAHAYLWADGPDSLSDWNLGLNDNSKSIIAMVRYFGLGRGVLEYRKARTQTRVFIACRRECYQATQICRSVYGVHDPRYAEALIQETSIIPIAQGRNMVLEAAAIWRETATHPTGDYACWSLAWGAQRCSKDADVSFPMYQTALAGADRAYPPDSPYFTQFLFGCALGSALHTSDAVAGERFLRRSLSYALAQWKDEDVRTQTARKYLSQACERNGKVAEARELLSQRYTIASRNNKGDIFAPSNALADLSEYDTRHGNTKLAGEESAHAGELADAVQPQSSASTAKKTKEDSHPLTSHL